MSDRGYARKVLVLAGILVGIVLGPALLYILLGLVEPSLPDYVVTGLGSLVLTGSISSSLPERPADVMSEEMTLFDYYFIVGWSVIVAPFIVAFVIVLIWLPSRSLEIKARQGVALASREELRSRLLGLNDPKIPFEIVADDKNPNKLVARWKVVDSKWISIFAANRLSIYYELRMQLVEGRGDKNKKKKYHVKAQDYFREIEYIAGIHPLDLTTIRLRYNFNLNKGIIPYYYDRRLYYGLIYKDGQLKFDYAYNFRFNVSEIKNPIIKVITESGWHFRPVIFLIG